MLAGAAKMAADVKWCSSCEKAVGVKSRVRLMQINLEEAALLCENPQCTSNTTSKMILPRSFSKLKRKKPRQSLSSSVGNPAASMLPPSPRDPFHDHLQNGIPGSTNSGTMPSLQLKTQLWEQKVLQWKNKDALCWLDVSMCALVHCTSLRSCLQRQGEESLLKELCREFDKAQVVEEAGGTAGEPTKQLHERTNHDRLCNGQKDFNVMGDQGKGGGGCPVKTPLESTASDLTHNQSMQCSLQPSLGNLEAEAALEWLVMSDDDSAKQRQLFKANQQTKTSTTCSTTKQDAASILECIREKMRKALEPKLGCKLGKEETPVFALPLLARLSGAVEEHFLVRYRLEFYCKDCHHTEVKTFKKAVISLTTVDANFSLSSPAIPRMCPACRSPGQISQMIYHSLPACMTFHFTQGVHNPDPMSYNMSTESGRYEVFCVIQYISNPNHFVAWIRDIERGMWLKCNDLELSVCEWQAQPPSIPASEIHVVMMERQGQPCTECDAMSSAMVKIRNNIDHVVERMASSNATGRKSPALRHNGASASVGALNHLWQKRPSSFQSYSSASREQTSSHLKVIDLDQDEDDRSETASEGPEENGLNRCNGAKIEESWSRSSSPLTISSTHTRKRSLPKYLNATNHPRNNNKEQTNGVHKRALTERTKQQNYTKSETPSLGCKTNQQLESSATNITFGSNNVYTKKLRSNRRSLTNGLCYSRKSFYPSYSEAHARQSNSINQPESLQTLAASLPEGALVRYSMWRKKSVKLASVSDRNTDSNSGELTFDTKSLLAVPKSTRPRCDSLSSVSSPSACSDMSSLSDNTSAGSAKDDLSTTIDELYKALKIEGETSQLPSRIPSPTLDDEFLAEILADDPVPAVLPSADDSGRCSNSRSEPSVENSGRAAGTQELDGIMPSIEPMAQELLAKLVG